MKNLITLLIILAITFATVSCAKKIPYSKEVESTYGITEKNMSQLQFYLVNDIVLVSDDSQSNNSTDLDAYGHIIVKEKSSMDRIIIKAGTRGVFEGVKGGNNIAISFETGEDRNLTFGASTSRGKYIIQALEWNSDGSGVVEYAKRKYKLSKTSNGAYITVKLKKTKQLNSSSRIAKGRKV